MAKEKINNTIYISPEIDKGRIKMLVFQEPSTTTPLFDEKAEHYNMTHISFDMHDMVTIKLHGDKVSAVKKYDPRQ